jgi:ABC-type transport system involved in multi-copper enzyme maturation permease subunit
MFFSDPKPIDWLTLAALTVVGLLVLAGLVYLAVGLFRARSLVRRELGAYFLSPVAYVVLIVFLAMTGHLFYRTLDLLTARGPRGAEWPMQSMFADDRFWLVFLFIPPLLTMRLFAEERASGTLEVLLTAPVRDWQVVAAKYVACLAFYVVMWLPTLAYLPALLGASAPVLPAGLGAAFTPWRDCFLAGVGAFAVGVVLLYVRLGIPGRLFSIALTLAGLAAAVIGAVMLDAEGQRVWVETNALTPQNTAFLAGVGVLLAGAVLPLFGLGRRGRLTSLALVLAGTAAAATGAVLISAGNEWPVVEAGPLTLGLAAFVAGVVVLLVGLVLALVRTARRGRVIGLVVALAGAAAAAGGAYLLQTHAEWPTVTVVEPGGLAPGAVVLLAGVGVLLVGMLVPFVGLGRRGRGAALVLALVGLGAAVTGAALLNAHGQLAWVEVGGLTPWSSLFLAGLGVALLGLCLLWPRLDGWDRAVSVGLTLAGLAAAVVGGVLHYTRDPVKLIEVPVALDPHPVLSTYLAMFLAGAMFLAVGLLVSSLVRDQLVAALLTFAVGLLFVVAGFFRPEQDGGAFYQAVYFFSVPLHFDRAFTRGVVDTRPLVLYASVALYCLFLTVRSLERRRWS